MASSMHGQISSPGSQGRRLPSSALSVHHHDLSPPAMTDPTLISFSERLDELHARLNELRSAVLTRDEYVDRRNREDEHIKREFHKLHHANEKILSITKSLEESIARISKDFASLRSDVERMDRKMVGMMTNINVVAGDMTDMRKRMFDLEIGILGLKGKVSQIEDDVSVLREDVSDLKQNVTVLRTDVSGVKDDVSDIKQNVSELKQGFAVLKRDFSGLKRLESRFDISDRIRFNSLACGIHAPISIVPRFDENGIAHYPKYFPSTVWRFWCLKKPKRIHRLIELAEFYDLKSFHSWRDSQASTLDSDLSESEDEGRPLLPTVAEAARLYPEACHRALAATLGLNYRKIEKEIERSEEYKRASKRSAGSTPTTPRKKMPRAGPPSRVEDPQIPRFSPPRRKSPKSVTTSQEGYVVWRQSFDPHSGPVITDNMSWLAREDRPRMELEHREQEKRERAEQCNHEELQAYLARQPHPRTSDYSLSNPGPTVPTVPFSEDESIPHSSGKSEKTSEDDQVVQM